jgi:hypothetical protein
LLYLFIQSKKNKEENKQGLYQIEHRRA